MNTNDDRFQQGRDGARTMAACAVGAVLAIVGMQAWSATAAPGDEDATYQPLNPCRLIDTRAGDANVGGRTAPLGPDEIYAVQVTGTNGNCTDIPAGAVAVAANITVVNSTAPSFLSVFPADLAEPPTVSSLNYSAGSPPTPNKVDSKLSPDGKVKLYNAFGNADVIVDVVGVYVNSGLVEIENRLAALEARDIELANDIRDAIPSTLTRTASDTTVSDTWSSVVTTGSINLTRAGTIVAFASATAFESEAGADVQCVITDRTSGFTPDESMLWEAAGATADSIAGEGDAANLSGNTSFTVASGTTGQYHLMCRNREADLFDQLSSIWDPRITVIFIPNR